MRSFFGAGDERLGAETKSQNSEEKRASQIRSISSDCRAIKGRMPKV